MAEGSEDNSTNPIGLGLFPKIKRYCDLRPAWFLSWSCTLFRGKLAKKGTKRKLPSRREELQSPKTQNSSPTNAKGPRNRVKVFQRKSVEGPPAFFF